MTSRKYEIFDYDVWGNAKEGYDVNDCRGTGEIITLKEDDSDAKIIKKLRDCGFLKKGVHARSFDVEGEMDYVLYITSSKDMYPVCELRVA